MVEVVESVESVESGESGEYRLSCIVGFGKKNGEWKMENEKWKMENEHSVNTPCTP